jgi:hypothetical protein
MSNLLQPTPLIPTATRWLSLGKSMGNRNDQVQHQ